MSEVKPAISAVPAPAKAGMSTERKKKIAMIAVPIVVLLVGYLVYQSFMFVSTDDAQVGAHSTLLSAKVSGIVTKANVEENQKVKAGDVLVEIKADDYQNMIDQLQGDEASLQAQLKAAQAIIRERFRSSEKEPRLRSASIRPKLNFIPLKAD
jgi:multidrug resistance efflux pump